MTAKKMKKEKEMVPTPQLNRGTDESKITRKQSKASKHGHENQKSTKPKPRMSSPTPMIDGIGMAEIDGSSEGLEASAWHYK
ncbi:hypothetical protein Tco_1525334 [Tanacetum coccineum]